VLHRSRRSIASDTGELVSAAAAAAAAAAARDLYVIERSVF